jgi:hypothetical protein
VQTHSVRTRVNSIHSGGLNASIVDSLQDLQVLYERIWITLQ